MALKNSGGVSFLTSETLNGCTAAFSTRVGGVSTGAFSSLNLGTARGDERGAVLENHRRFAETVGFDWKRSVFSAQVHGDVVRVASDADAGLWLDGGCGYSCDALISNTPGLPLMIFTADCTPVLLFDPVKGAVGAVHAGWRGTALSIAEKTVLRMADEFGCVPGDIRAAIGPCISKCCFETDADVPEAMRARYGADADGYIEKAGGKWRVDLKGINALSLRRAGVRDIDVLPECTVCDSGLFYSHRRDGQARGSLASVIVFT